jgi:hypothetical protein
MELKSETGIERIGLLERKGNKFRGKRMTRENYWAASDNRMDQRDGE